MFVNNSTKLSAMGLTLLLIGQCGNSMAGTWVKRSTAGGCTNGYTAVTAFTLPDNTAVPAFCVMKYEAKKSRVVSDRNIDATANALAYNNAYPVSEPDNLPWVGLTWQDANAACIASGAALISENQWLSIAHQITNAPGNWSGNAVGNGYLYSGHNDGNPAAALAASSLDTDGYFGTLDSATSPGDNLFGTFASNTPAAYAGQKRTLTLPNGNVLWDFSGNVAEWVNQSAAQTSRPHGGASLWMSYNADDGTGKIASNVLLAKRPPSPYNANNGMGRYYDGASTVGGYNNILEAPDNCGAIGYCAPTVAYLRGGRWIDGPGAGVFSLSLENGRSTAQANIGFRCVK